MLVTFSCPTHGDVTYFKEIAIHLLGLMGRSDTIPSALYASDVPAALARLDAMVGVEESAPASTQNGSEDDSGTAAVSIASRALPLRELLVAAVEGNSTVMWEYS